MGKKLTAKENELYKRTDEVLHYIWDPFAVAGTPYARDEYWGYLPTVFNMLLKNVSDESIERYLITVEKEDMEIPPNVGRANRVAKILRSYKEKIDEELF